MRRLAIILICFFAFSACGTSEKTPDDNTPVRWPNFISDWAVDFGLNTSERLQLINTIDSVYQFLEDSTASMTDYCATICRMKDGINEALIHDEDVGFRCMMRATAHNFWGYSMKDKRFFECDCSGEILSSVVTWHTNTTDSADFMSFVLIPVSWEAPAHFAELCMLKFDDRNYYMAGLNICNYDDMALDSILISFADSTDRIIDEFDEMDLYVDSTNINTGEKILFLPFEDVVYDLLHSDKIIVTHYDGSGEVISIWGIPGAAFEAQVIDCPRMVAGLKQLGLKQ